MKKPEITKGKWKRSGNRICRDVDGKDGYGIAHLHADGPMAEWQPNLEAIAALPDLLEALEGVLLFLEQGMKDSNFGSAGTEALDIQKALTKAGYTFD